MQGLWELAALAVYGPLVVLLHELGHALFAGRAGFRVVGFSVGLGKPLVRLGEVGGASVTIGRWVLAGGACTAIPVGAVRPRRAWFHAGGLLVQALLAAALWWVASDLWWVQRIETFNVLVFLTNAAPWRFSGAASDGWQLWQLFRGGRRAIEVLPQRAALRRVARQARAAGSGLGAAWADLSLAWSDVIAGRLSDAAAFFDDLPMDLRREPYLVGLAAYVEASWHRQAERPLAALSEVRSARAMSHLLGEDARGLLVLAEAGALLDLGEPDAARKVLAGVLGADDAVSRQAMALLLGSTLDRHPDDVEFATWRVVRRIDEAWLDPVEAALVLWAAASVLDEAGRRQAADGARDAARALGRRTVETASAEDGPALRLRLGSVLDVRFDRTERFGSN